MLYIRKGMLRSVSPVTRNPLKEKDLVDNKGLQMAIDAALQNALRDVLQEQKNDKKSSSKKHKSRRFRIPNKLSASMKAGVGLAKNEIKAGVGLLNELSGERIVRGKSDATEDEQNMFVAECQVEGGSSSSSEDECEGVGDVYTPSAIPAPPPPLNNLRGDDPPPEQYPTATNSGGGRQRTRRAARRADQCGSMTTGNSALDARIHALQQSEALRDDSYRNEAVRADSDRGIGVQGVNSTVSTENKNDAERAFEERLRKKLSQGSVPASPERLKTKLERNQYEDKLKKKLSDSGGSSSQPQTSKDEQYEEKLRSKLSRSAGHAAQDTYESKLQRKLANSVGPGVVQDQSVKSLDNYESKLQRKLPNAGSSRSENSSRSVGSGYSNEAANALDSYESKLQRKISQNEASESASRLDSYERKLLRKLSDESRRKTIASENDERSMQRKDSAESRRITIGREDSARGIEAEKVLDDYESKLQRKLASSKQDAAGKALDDYESKLRRKLSESSRTVESESSNQNQTGKVKSPPETYEQKLIRKLSSDGSNTAGSKPTSPQRPGIMSTESSRRLDSFEERIAAKTKEGDRKTDFVSTESSRRLDSFEERIAAKNKQAEEEDNKVDASLKQGARGKHESKSGRKNNRRDMLDQKLKQSLTNGNIKSIEKDDSGINKPTVPKDVDEKSKRRRNRRNKEDEKEKIRASLKSDKKSNGMLKDPPERGSRHLSELTVDGSSRHLSELTIDEDVEGVSDSLHSSIDERKSTGRNRARPNLNNYYGGAKSMRMPSDLTVEEEEEDNDDEYPKRRQLKRGSQSCSVLEQSNQRDEVSWGDLEGDIKRAQQMSMSLNVVGNDAMKLQAKIEASSWDDFEEEIQLAQQMSMKVAANDAMKLQAELDTSLASGDADTKGGGQLRGPVVAPRKARGRRRGEGGKKRQQDSDNTGETSSHTAKIDRILPILEGSGKNRSDIINALEESNGDEAKALTLLLS